MKRRATLRILKTNFFFVFLIALFLIICYFQYYSILKQREHAGYSSIISSGMDIMESQISSLISLSQITNADNRYRRLFAKDVEGSRVAVSDYVPLNQVQADFQALIGTQSLISDAGIFFGGNTLLTRNRSIVNYSLPFYGNFFTHGTSTEGEWISMLKANTKGGFLPQDSIQSTDYGIYDGFTFICAWPPGNVNTYAGILYSTIKTSDFLNQVVPPEILENGYVLLYDNLGNPLVDLGSQNRPGMKGQVLTCRTNHFFIEVGVSAALIDSHLTPVRRLLAGTLFSTLAAFAGLALFFTQRNSKPIRQLLYLVNGVNAIDQEENSLEIQNEYDFIASTVKKLDHTAYTYAQTIQSQQDIIRHHLFDKALTDGLHSTRQQEEFARHFPAFPHRYQLASILFDTNGCQVTVLFALAGEASAFLPPEVYVQFHEENSLILVLPMKNESSPCWEDALTGLHTKLTGKYDMDFRICLSEYFTQCRQLTEAYSQLRSIDLSSGGEIWGRSSQPGCVVRRFCDLKSYSPSLSLDFGSMQQLYNMLRVGDIESARSILDTNLQSLFRSGYIDEVFVKQIFYNFRNILLRVKVENSNQMLDVTIPLYDAKADIKTLFSHLTACCEAICARIEQAREDDKNQFSEAVCGFIRQNITNQELYAKMVASNFGISETTLQKIIKASTGKTFFEYVDEQRMDLACSLLKTTTAPINSIAAQCGFSSPNSFYKAFKRRYGMSPGAAREQGL